MKPSERANEEMREESEAPGPPAPEGVAPERGFPRSEPVAEASRKPDAPGQGEVSATPRVVNVTLLVVAVGVVIATAVLLGLTTSRSIGVAVAIAGLVLAVGVNPVVWSWLRGDGR